MAGYTPSLQDIFDEFSRDLYDPRDPFARQQYEEEKRKVNFSFGIVEDPDDRESDPAPINGSRCFVLVKHQILLDKETVKDFFSLYMHLSPLENFPNMVKEYPENNTGISWLDSLLFRSNKFFRICWGRRAKIY